MEPIRSITFVVNRDKEDAEEIAAKLANIAGRKGATTRIKADYPLPTDALAGSDLCCVVGGDGTLLGVLDAALESGCPVLGINRGKLGFLATFNEDEAVAGLPALIDGHYAINERTVLRCTSRSGETVHGLNDVVIKETEGRGLVRLHVHCDGHRVSEYHCDGLILSTPTGSTAYNLSAGGPIISPGVNAIAMTPICPHTFGNRSVIFDGDSTVKIDRGEPGPCPRVTTDGRVRFKDGGVFPIEVTVCETPFRLMQNPDHSHFAIVRNKLDWGDPAIRE